MIGMAKVLKIYNRCVSMASLGKGSVLIPTYIKSKENALPDVYGIGKDCIHCYNLPYRQQSHRIKETVKRNSRIEMAFAIRRGRSHFAKDN